MIDIDRNSPAAGFGFQPRDIIREVNGEEIDTAEKLKQRRGAPRAGGASPSSAMGELLRQMLGY